jgi:protein ImuA
LPLLPAVDRLWPEQGLPLGALHEASSDGSLFGTAALTGFAAALAGRLGRVLWCSRTRDGDGSTFYGPGLARLGLKPDQLLAVTASSDAGVLGAMEEGLRHPVLAAVVGEVDRLDLTASRRLQLAAEKSGVTAFVLRVPMRRVPMRRLRTSTVLEPVAAASRWRITVLPSAPPVGRHVIAEAGVARWRLELLASRSGATGQWSVEVPDAQGHFRLSAPLVDESADAGVAEARSARGRRRAAG